MAGLRRGDLSLGAADEARLDEDESLLNGVGESDWYRIGSVIL